METSLTWYSTIRVLTRQDVYFGVAYGNCEYSSVVFFGRWNFILQRADCNLDSTSSEG